MPMMKPKGVPRDKPITCERCGVTVAAQTAAAQRWRAVGGVNVGTGFICLECLTAKTTGDDLETLNGAVNQLHKGLSKREQGRAHHERKSPRMLYR